MLLNKFSKMKWWQVALIALVASAIGGLASLQSSKKGKALYLKKLKQAPWAPPSWLFGPAWTINNYFLLLALQHLLKGNTNDSKKLLILQSFIWAIYFSFGYVYFNKKSPVLAAAWTISDAVLAIASYSLAYKDNKRLSSYYLPLIVWTSFASSLALYQAIENDDPVFKKQLLL